jgi:hypothetical protein
MNRRAVVARIFLRTMPPYIRQRLLSRQDIFEVASLGHGKSQSGLQLDYQSIRAILTKLPMEEVKRISTQTTPGWFPLRRSLEGIWVGNPGTDETTIRFPELGLFDPDREVRRKCFAIVLSKVAPVLPHLEDWRARVDGAPLSVHEFTALLLLLGETAKPILSAIEALAEFSVDELVPISETYYQSLVGIVPPGADPLNAYEEWLLPHLRAALSTDLEWGWRCTRAAYTSAYFSPAEVCGDIDSERLLVTIGASSAATPQALLASLEVALVRGTDDPRFMAQAEQALAKIVVAFRGADASRIGDLSAAFAILTLRKISADPQLAHTPTSWRRLASLAHADMLCHVLELEGEQAGEVSKRCWGMSSVEALAADLSDLQIAPTWQPLLELSKAPWLQALGRAILLVEAAKSRGIAVPSEALDAFLAESDTEVGKTAARLNARGPHVLSGTRRLQAVDDVETLAAVELGTASWPRPWSSNEWRLLLVCATQIFFDKSLVDVIMEEVTALLKRQEPIADQLAPLYIVARIAAAQGNLTLAAAITEQVNSVANELGTPESVAFAFQIVAAAAAASADRAQWIDQLRDAFRDLARQVPKGTCAGELAGQVAALERFVPLHERRWRVAISLARAAS